MYSSAPASPCFLSSLLSITLYLPHLFIQASLALLTPCAQAWFWNKDDASAAKEPIADLDVARSLKVMIYDPKNIERVAEVTDVSHKCPSFTDTICLHSEANTELSILSLFIGCKTKSTRR